MKMRKPCKGRLVNVVLKNAKFWNGKSFELQSEVRLNACETSETVEFDCNGALVMPALFGLGLDFMEPLRDDVYTFADGFEAMRKGGFYGGLYESAANPIDDADKYTAMVNRFKSEERGEEAFDIKFLGAYSKGFGTDSLAEMVELAEAGVAGFGDGNGVIPHSRFLRLDGIWQDDGQALLLPADGQDAPPQRLRSRRRLLRHARHEGHSAHCRNDCRIHGSRNGSIPPGAGTLQAGHLR